MTNVTIRRALLSVSDKAGLVELGQALGARGVELVSTGGTAKALRDAGLTVKDISELTGFPEMMDGRVKTLHPKVHGGLLAVRDNPEHAAAMADHQIGAIDLVVVNLYPFEATVAKGAERDEVIENIDIGGPSMVRSAAKNHAYVTIVTDPSDYAGLLAELESNDGATSYEFRKLLAARAFAATAAYDSMISQWFALTDQQQVFPETLAITATRAEELRYGENPHQRAALYIPRGPHGQGIAQARQLQGKELSYNNYNDADAALELCAEFKGQDPAVVIVKHANPCGVAQGSSLLDAWQGALQCDDVSAFGGIVAVNVPLDGPTAEAICEIFTEVVVAPDADEAAMLNALEAAGAEQFLARDEGGFDRIVGEAGARLSGGQRSFLTIARALVKPSQLLFLDEPSGAMDSQSEKLLVERLSRFMTPEQTLVISTHRPALLSVCDRIVVLDRGRVVVDGPAGDVLSRAGTEIGQ